MKLMGVEWTKRAIRYLNARTAGKSAGGEGHSLFIRRRDVFLLRTRTESRVVVLLERGFVNNMKGQPGKCSRNTKDRTCVKCKVKSPMSEMKNRTTSRGTSWWHPPCFPIPKGCKAISPEEILNVDINGGPMPI